MIVAARIVDTVPIIIVVTTSARDGSLAERGRVIKGGAARCRRATRRTSRRLQRCRYDGAAAQRERQRDEHVPRIADTEPLRERVEAGERVEQRCDALGTDP